MKLNLPGLLKERLPSGGFRYRVRTHGNKARRITLTVTPDHKEFLEHYHAARRGISLTPEIPAEDRVIRGSIDWLVIKHLTDLEKKVQAGQYSQLTLKKRSHLLNRFRAEYGEYALDMPATKVVEFRDSMISTPASADSMVEAIRVLYRWGCSVGYCDVNPAMGVGKIDKGKGGALPWTAADLKKFKKFHGKGTTPYLTLTLFMFTACRIGDAIRLGRNHEFERNGVRGLAWQPAKKGSARVEIPMLPPLYKATRAASVVGETYLLNHKGQPFSTPDSLGQMFRRWCRDAGLQNRSSHGIRKAAAHLLAQEGCTQYQIMSIHGHTQAQTSEIYTKGVERWRMASEAMQRLEGLDW
ncbi:site-specific integrase [Thalassobius sp. I31.1]|uniref:tyrosine-type recombinase/integrase n=1 Tax=Thalassobius sp. I31.1 TaxID=2109912 RepID=UPI000D1BDB25|nr:site-specific integrase [Thalassobius sp. I31.1]